MRWRDVRFDKPTKEDELNGQIIQKLTNGKLCLWPASNVSGCVAWLSLSKLPQPDLAGPIPDEWRPVDKAVDVFDDRAKYWLDGKWRRTNRSDDWDPAKYYIVPIYPPDPPKPQYRAFASWQEWWPNHGRWYRDADGCICTAWLDVTEAELDFAGGAVFLNEDGTDAEPYGVKVQ
jgi:hypothetical protein